MGQKRSDMDRRRNSYDLLSIVSFLERDRGVKREIIVQAIESAIQQSARKNVEFSKDLRVEIDRKTFKIKAYDTFVVTEEKNDPGMIPLRYARRYKKDARPGDLLEIEIEPEMLGRIVAQTARQMILQKIREAERKNVYDEYKDRIGEFVSGTVRQVIHRDLIVDLGKAEAVLPAKECIPTEDLTVGDTIRAYIYRVQSGVNGPSVVLSRACPEFVKKLFQLEVAEIADGIVEIMAVARDAGFRSKIAVRTLDEKVDPVGACVGLRGARVRNIIRELNGEKIDIVRWSPDIRQYVTQALAPARLETIDVDHENRSVLVTVAPDQLSLAIGKRGQNVKLCTRLTGWRIGIEKSGEPVSFEAQRQTAIHSLAETLNVGEVVATRLVESGFLTPEGIIAVDASYLQEVTGLEAPIAESIWITARSIAGNQ